MYQVRTLLAGRGLAERKATIWWRMGETMIPGLGPHGAARRRFGWEWDPDG